MPDPNQPKLRTYCAALYERFLAESTVDEETGYTVWRGHFTKTARDIGVPEGTYKRVMDALYDLHCVELVERGFRGNATSVIILLKPPTAEVWDSWDGGRKPLTRRSDSATLSRRVEELERRLEGLDVKQALVDLHNEIQLIHKEREVD